MGWWLAASYWRLCAACLPSPLRCPLRSGIPPSISSSLSLVWVCFRWCCSVAYCVSRAAAVCVVSAFYVNGEKVLWLVAVCLSCGSLLSAPLLPFGCIFLCELVFRGFSNIYGDLCFVMFCCLHAEDLFVVVPY